MQVQIFREKILTATVSGIRYTIYTILFQGQTSNYPSARAVLD